MVRAITDNRKPGRPPIGATLIGVRLPPAQLALLDRYIEAERAHAATCMSRPEALRRLAFGNSAIKRAGGRPA